MPHARERIFRSVDDCRYNAGEGDVSFWPVPGFELPASRFGAEQIP
jgi:hypothetical protein